VAPERVLFAGDVHLHAARPEGGERFRRFLAEVVRGAASLYLLGDLFDHWVSPQQARIPFYAGVLAALRETARSGVDVAFTPGNRDFLLDDEALAAAGMRRLPSWHEIRLGDEYVLLTHGDLLCTRDRPYQRMRAALRLPVFPWVARCIPLRVAAGLGERLRGVSRRAVAAKRPEVCGLAPEAVARCFSSGRRDAIVCGHVHRPGEWRGRVAGRSRRLLVLPEWAEAAGWIEWRAGGWRILPGTGGSGGLRTPPGRPGLDREPTSPAFLPVAPRSD
jgi:UDP-2,3-diacylglucosamine hydrolase